MTKPRYFEDFNIGERFETGSRPILFEEAIAFAERHDPQLFHTDEEVARWHPVFRGLSASGYMTLLITHELILEREIGHAWGLIGKGIDGLRWTQPVRPGDVLRVVGTVVAADRLSGQRFGTVEVGVETINQRGETVMTMTAKTIVPSRAAIAESLAKLAA